MRFLLIYFLTYLFYIVIYFKYRIYFLDEIVNQEDDPLLCERHKCEHIIEIKHNKCEFASSTVSHIRQHVESKHEYPLSNLGFRIVRRRNKDVQYCPKKTVEYK